MQHRRRTQRRRAGRAGGADPARHPVRVSRRAALCGQNRLAQSLGFLFVYHHEGAGAVSHALFGGTGHQPQRPPFAGLSRQPALWPATARLYPQRGLRPGGHAASFPSADADPSAREMRAFAALRGNRNRLYLHSVLGGNRAGQLYRSASRRGRRICGKGRPAREAAADGHSGAPRVPRAGRPRRRKTDARHPAGRPRLSADVRQHGVWAVGRAGTRAPLHGRQRNRHCDPLRQQPEGEEAAGGTVRGISKRFGARVYQAPRAVHGRL